MSRYLILVILTLPFILAGMLNTLISYKINRYSQTKFFFQMALWLSVFAGVVFAKPIYEFLFSRNLTVSEPLSLFDVIQITGIVFLLFVATRARNKLEILERRVQDLHQELSIRLSENKKNQK